MVSMCSKEVRIGGVVGRAVYTYIYGNVNFKSRDILYSKYKSEREEMMNGGGRAENNL